MTSKPYHKFVFDTEKRRFVGQFEEMYRAEDEHGFDSWHQNDLSNIGRSVAKLLLDRIAYSKVLDLGCGKGAFTGALWKENAEILAVDLSPTAIQKAKAVFGDKIQFQAADAVEFLRAQEGRFDLIFTAELLSYIEAWPEVIRLAAEKSDYFCCTLYIPENPIGFVKSGDDLRSVISKHFRILHDIEIRSSREFCILAGRK